MNYSRKSNPQNAIGGGELLQEQDTVEGHQWQQDGRTCVRGLKPGFSKLEHFPDRRELRRGEYPDSVVKIEVFVQVFLFVHFSTS